VKRGLDKVARQKAILVALSDDLSLPLIQIKTGLELIGADDFSKKAVREQTQLMTMSAASGLHLIEAYRLLLRTDEILNLPLEAVAVGTVLEEVAHQITPYAKQFATNLNIDIQGRFTPVLAHKPSLACALEVLGTSLISAQAAQSQKTKYSLTLGAHRSPEGRIATGVFSDVQGLSARSLKAARSLVGQAHQPLPAIPQGSISGILVADMLCSALWQPLHAVAHRDLSGLATGLPLTSQLKLV